MRTTSILALVLLLTACTQSIDVPVDKYAILFRLGKIEDTTPGPAALHKTAFIESVLFINKSHEFELNDGQYIIKYTVNDPAQYFKEVHGNNSILEVLKIELVKQGINSQAITSKEQLYQIIEKLNLPITLDKNA